MINLLTSYKSIENNKVISIVGSKKNVLSVKNKSCQFQIRKI